ncbi:MAG: hypothetical protein ACPGYL_13145, partial [Rhodospirillaceae bacterium]
QRLKRWNALKSGVPMLEAELIAPNDLRVGPMPSSRIDPARLFRLVVSLADPETPHFSAP